jgi:chitodextrinase
MAASVGGAVISCEELSMSNPDRAVRATVEGLEHRTFLAADPVSGIAAVYYDNISRTGTKVAQIEETIDVDFGAGEPAAGIAPTNYAVRWQGRIKARAGGKYTFALTHDDQAILYINGKRILGGGNNTNAGREDTATIALRKNQLYSIRVDYLHFNGDAKVQLAWDGPGFEKEVIPAEAFFLANGQRPADTRAPLPPRQLQALTKTHESVTLGWVGATDNVRVVGYDVFRDGTKLTTLGGGATRYVDDGLELGTEYEYQVVAFDAAGNRSLPATLVVTTNETAPPTNGLTGEYFNDTFLSGTPVVRIDKVMNLNFGTGSPIAGIDPTTYSVRWTGQVLAPKTERFTFHVTSDDGVRLKVNGQTLIERFSGTGPQSNFGFIDLVRGQKYDIQIEYLNQVGAGFMRLMWSSQTTPLQVVPVTNLFTDPLVDNSLDAPDASATVLSRTSVRVEWDLVDDATGYVVERSRSANGTFQRVFEGASGATAFTDQNLLAGTDYFYRVRAVGEGDLVSGWSSTLRVTTNSL